MIFTFDTIRIGLLVGLATFALVEVAKPYLKRYGPTAWPRLVVRLGALAIGSSFGFLLQMDAEGAMLGLCGAGLSATLVAAFKRFVRARSSS